MTVESISELTLEEAKRIISKLREENGAQKSRINELEAKIDELLRRSEKQDTLHDEQMEAIGVLSTDVIEGRTDTKKLMKEVKHLRAMNEAHDLDQAILLQRTASISNQVQNLNVSNHDANHTLDLRWILYTSESNPIPPDYVKEMPENCLWIMSHARENKNVRLPNDAVILLDLRWLTGRYTKMR